MRPKWLFILKAVSAGLVGIILVFASLYLASFVFFILYENGIWSASEFGIRGVHLILTSLPWLLIGILILFIIAIEMLTRAYSFAYRQPLLITTLGIACLIISISYAVSLSPLHRSLSRLTELSHNPIGMRIYREIGHPRLNLVHAGIIENYADDIFTLHTIRDELLQILVSPSTQISHAIQLNVGDRVIVFGRRNGNSVSAFGIRKRNETEQRERNIRPGMY